MYGFETELRKMLSCKCKDAVPDGLKQRIAEAIHHSAGNPAETPARAPAKQ
jgi:hypothetical protein